MDYKTDIYETDDQNLYRFALGSLSEKTLFVFGINPSTADDAEPDPTMKQVMFFAEKHEYTSFMMFNLYPLRETDPGQLPINPNQEMINRNINTIFDIISQKENVDIWVAWGGDIDSRIYLSDCLKKIYKKLEKCAIQSWLRLDVLLKSGHPKQRLYKSHKFSFQNMDMINYLENFDK